MAPVVVVVKDSNALAHAAAEHVIRTARLAVARSGQFSLCLSGGATPRALYELLAKSHYAERIEWPKVHVFWGDERCVSAHDSASNFHMAQEALLRHVSISPRHIHRIRGEHGSMFAADEYERELHAFFPDHRTFDLILLGLGEDGHTASLFPKNPRLLATPAWVAAVEPAGTPKVARVTLTPALFQHAANALFLVEHAKKAAVLNAVLSGPDDPCKLPAQAIKLRSGPVTWLVDEKAAAQLTPCPQSTFKQRAGAYATTLIEPGMCVGLGSGSTALCALLRLATLLREKRLWDITAIASSQAVHAKAQQLGISLTSFAEHPTIDLTIDGADEIDADFAMIKGGGGAFLREKIVAQASRREVIVIDESKISSKLGTKRPVPVEVTDFGCAVAMRQLANLGASVRLRRDATTGRRTRTDEGHLIVDCDFGSISEPKSLAKQLDACAGILAHGLFLGLASDVVVAGALGLRHLRYGMDELVTLAPQRAAGAADGIFLT